MQHSVVSQTFDQLTGSVMLRGSLTVFRYLCVC